MRKIGLTVFAGLILFVPLLFPIAAMAQAKEPTPAFAEILEHYEAVRLALLSDSLDGVADHGREIEGIFEDLDGNWNPERAGVSVEKAEEAKALLPALSQAASQLAKVADIEAARTAFYEFSKPLVRFRAMATGDLPVVAYCPMAKRSWLQPEGELGNPYYGQSMATCGEVVDG